MKLGLGAGIVGGLIIFAAMSESKTPGSTAPVVDSGRTSVNNVAVGLGGTFSDLIHTAGPLVRDIQGEFTATFPGAADAVTGGQATHPDVPQVSQ